MWCLCALWVGFILYVLILSLDLSISHWIMKYDSSHSVYAAPNACLDLKLQGRRMWQNTHACSPGELKKNGYRKMER